METEDCSSGVPKSISGFVLKRSKALPQSSMTGHLYVHEKFGTPFLYLKTEDVNNFFSTHFRTPQIDNTGVSHMLEHLSLRGSEKYPINRVFMELNDRTYATFMNAMTAAEYTAFPFSSINEVAFMSILDVYLDCVFHPIFGEVDFQTECHHLEFEDNDPNKPLKHGGVIYNEMSGEYSSAQKIFRSKIMEFLYPDSLSRFDIGGMPSEIPKATFESVKKHHSTYYHPANGFFFFYGSFPVEPIFEKIEESIKSFTPIPSPYMPEKYVMKPWTEARKVDIECPANDELPIDEQYETDIAWVLDFKCTNDYLFSDIDDTLEILAHSNNSPLYQALVKTGLVKFLSTGISRSELYPYINITARGFKKEQTELIEKTIFEVITKAAEEGLDMDRLDAHVHQIKIYNKMVSSNQGMGLFSSCAEQWIHGADPLELIDFNKNLDISYQNCKQPGYMQSLIRTHILENKHCLISHFIPVEKYHEKVIDQNNAELAKIKESLTEEQIKEILEINERIEALKNQPQPVELLPQIKRADMNRTSVLKEPKYKEENVDVLINPTNGIVFLTIICDCPLDIPNSWILPLIEMITVVGAGKFDEFEMSHYIQRWLESASVSHGMISLPKDQMPHQIIKIFSVALEEDLDKIEEILSLFINEVHWDNYQKIEQRMDQLKLSIPKILKMAANKFGSCRAAANLTLEGALNEATNGATALRYLNDYINNHTAQELSSVLHDTFFAMITHSKVHAFISCEEKVKDNAIAVSNRLISKIQSLPKVSYEPFDYYSYIKGIFNSDKYFVEISIPSGFVFMKARCTEYSNIPLSPLLLILSNILSSEILKGVREKYGAYGGSAQYCQTSGVFSISTFRDTAPLKSIEVIQDIIFHATDYVTESSIESAVVSILSLIDEPEAIALVGYSDAISGITIEKRQQRRDVYLTATVEQVKEAAKFLSTQKFNITICTSSKIATPPEDYVVVTN